MAWTLEDYCRGTIAFYDWFMCAFTQCLYSTKYYRGRAGAKGERPNVKPKEISKERMKERMEGSNPYGSKGKF